MKRSLAFQILGRGRSNGCAHNLAKDGKKRGSNDISHRLERLSTPGSASPSLWRLSIQFKATAHKLALREPNRRAWLGCGSLERHQAPCLPRTIVASHRGDRSRFCCWIEHGKSGRLCDLGLHRRLRSLDPYCRPKLHCTLFMGSRCSHPHSDRIPECFRSHLKSIPFGETRTLTVLFSRLRRRQTYAIRLRSLLTTAPV